MKKIILFGFMLLAFSSCAKLEEIKVKDAKIKNVAFNTMTEVTLDLVLTVENPNTKKISIDNVELDAWLGETHLGLVETLKKTALPPSFTGDVEIPLQLTCSNLKALMAIANDFDKIFDKFEVTGFAKIKMGAFVRKHKIERTTIKKLLQDL
jgi:LEA14-like dessication related protein